MTILVLLAVPMAIFLNGEEILHWNPKEWGIFITVFLFIMCIFSILVATSDGSNTDKLP